MMHWEHFDIIDYNLWDIYEDLLDGDHPFRDVSLVLDGDFQQILPIILYNNHCIIITSYLQYTVIWGILEFLLLHHNMYLDAASSPTNHELACFMVIMYVL